MSIQMILAPVFVQVLLTLLVMFTMAFRRASAIRGGELTGPIDMRQNNWPVRAQQAANNYANQFELPVLFYVLAILSIITRHADLFFVLMAWVFVVLRIAHAGVHLTSNFMPARGGTFAASALVLTIMWLVFMVRIMLSLP